MALPLPPNVIPLSAATAARVVPFLRVVPAASSVATLSASGAAGAIFGTALPLAASFALGFEIGTQLLRLWNYLNQKDQPGPPATIPLVGKQIPSDGWFPTIGYQVWGTPAGRSDVVYLTGINKTWPLTAELSVIGVVPGGTGPADRMFRFRGSDDTGPGEEFRALYAELRHINPAPGPGQSYSDPPATGGLPFVKPALIPQPLPQGFVLPEVAPGVAPSPPPTRREDPKAPPVPGTPAPLPAVPGAVPGGAPGRQPGGRPAAPGVGPAPAVPLQPIGDPVKGPAPATVPTVDPARPPLTVPGPGTVPVAPPPLVPVTDPDLIRIGNLIIGDPGERPRPDLVSISKELGRQEQKLAGLLGGLGLPEAFDQLLDLFKSINTGTTYSLTPPCGTTAGGDPLPAVEVIVPPTIGDNAAIIARIDALAMLLDEHKQMRQPICKGKPTGSPVTVTALEVE